MEPRSICAMAYEGIIIVYIRRYLIRLKPLNTTIKMIGGFKILFTITRPRLIRGKSWKETKDQIDKDAKNNPEVKSIDPIVGSVAHDVRGIPGMGTK